MFILSRFRLWLINGYRQFTNVLTGSIFNFNIRESDQFIPRLATQTVTVGLLAVALWVTSVGAYSQPAQAGDNLDARPYEAEAVRQSRNPVSRDNGASQVAPSGLSEAPEDQAKSVLENVKDAVQDIIPGMSGDEGVGQNANNPNTPVPSPSNSTPFSRR
ncbi:hypothetical protein [Nodosilinea sp. E11]|uniref:hypothetical protein n=1 Tax=Nodosilinea sp. E11 TaxID=3037479 RepID=UPI002934AD52|nr:hypothetical protein [Nodosilinea sp. E11]WOD39524.1 hypothetical protein RRF56_25280 [Nodosilinea sp. E11]